MAELPFISVDMAASGLERSGWASDLLSALGAEGLSGEGLIIELSENWQISCWPVLEENIAAVRRSGFRISVVDFGAGEVNLDLMSRLTIDVIALDRELTEQAMTSRRGAAIVHATTRSAHFAGTMIVASGVNDPAWVSELANLGVDFVRI